MDLLSAPFTLIFHFLPFEDVFFSPQGGDVIKYQDKVSFKKSSECANSIQPYDSSLQQCNADCDRRKLRGDH